MKFNNKSFVIVAGVHKAGTTSFYEYLRNQNEIFTPLVKELHFFTPLIYDSNFTINHEDYFNLFDGAIKEKYLIDVSPSYLYGGKVLINELKQLPNIKVILIFRNPVARFISFYKQGIKTGRISQKTSLDEYFIECEIEFNVFLKTGIVRDTFANRGLREGCYSLYLQDWVDEFGDNLKVILFEDLVSNPLEVMKCFSEWINVNLDYTDYEFTQKNKSVKPRSQKLSQLSHKTFRKYESFFRKHDGLKKILKRLYNVFNAKDYKNEKNERTEDKIFQFYSPYNKKLEIMLPSISKKISDWK